MAENKTLSLDITAASSLKAQEDAKELQAQRSEFLKKCKNAKKKKLKLSALYAQFLGTTYTYTLNGVPVTLQFDDKEHEFPDFIAESINAKLARINESLIPKTNYSKIL